MIKEVAQRVSGKIVLCALVLYYGFFVLFYMPFSPLNAMVMGDIKMDQVLDLKEGGYDVLVTTEAFESYGETGRKIYVRNLWTLDLLFPFLSLFSSVCLLLFCGRKIGGFFETFSYWGVFLPLSVMLCDYLENIVLSVAIVQFPTIDKGLIAIASLLTRCKWGGISVNALVILLLILVWLLVSVKRKMTSSSL